MRAFGSRKNAARACSTSPLPPTPAEPPLPNTCRVQLYGQSKAPARARRNLARSQSPQRTALPLRTHPRLRRRAVSHHKQVSLQAAASEAGACLTTAGHSSDTVTGTPIMLSNQNRYRAPPLAAEKGRLNKMTPAGSLFRRESGSLLERCKQEVSKMDHL